MKKRHETFKLNSRILFLLLIAFPGWCEGQRVVIDGSYTSEAIANLHGGIQTGTRYNGLAAIGALFSSDSLHLWHGGSWRIRSEWSQGGRASASLIGDDQTVSNIEAGGHLFMEELWYEQHWRRWTVTVGLQDLNAHYVVCGFSENYLNSSFGIMPTVATNFASPVYPLTGLALDLRYEANPQLCWQAALYDGHVTSFDRNPHNLYWNLNPREGFLALTEGILSPAWKRETRFSAGAFYHTAIHNYGFYGSASHTLWQLGDHSLHIFLQGSWATWRRSELPGYLGAGICADGVWSGHGRDWLGLAFAKAFQKGKAGETSIELSYLYRLNDHFSVQPDVQYILHPGGADQPLPASLAMLLRIKASF